MIDKKKAEVGRRWRYLGKMEKKFRGKLLLLGCLLLAIIPSIVYADYFDSLKVETFPILGSTDVTRGVEFQIRVVACNEFGDQITPATIDYGDAQYAPIILDSTDPSAEIYNDTTGQWISMNAPPFETALDGGGDRIFRIKLHEIGEDKRITAWSGLGWETIDEGFLNFHVHDFVDHFVIEPVPTQTAGATFNIGITAENSSNGTAVTFNDNIDIWAVIPQGTGLPPNYEPGMTPTTIAGSSFTDGVAIIPVTIYGSDPVNYLVTIECRNTVLHGGNYAEGELEVRVDPNSYDKILLLVEGEEHLPGSFDPDGKQGTSSPPWTAGVASPVDVYLTDEWWNPIQDSDIPPGTTITFTSDGAASLPSLPVMLVNPDTFQVTLYTAGPGHWVRIREGTPVKESVSPNIQVDPNNVAEFRFDNPIPPAVYTTDGIDIDVTAYDASGNVAIDYNGWADLRCSLGDQYIIPDGIDFSDGRASASVNVTLRGNNVTITVDDGVNSVTSNSFNVSAGDFSQLLVLLDGESHTPGLGPYGKSLTPNPITAGESTTVTIIATDDWWNKKSEAGAVQITDISCPTGYIVPPVPLPVLIKAGIPGEGDCQVTFRTAKTASGVDERQIIRVSGDGREGESSSLIVSPKPYRKLVLVAPDEQLDPGTLESDSKSGYVSPQTAGEFFDLTVAATDEYGNPVDSGYPEWIRFLSWDYHEDVLFAGEVRGTFIHMADKIRDYYGNNRLITLDSSQLVWVLPWMAGGEYGLVEIPVTHGRLHHYAFNPSLDTITAGETIENFTITAQDEYNNTYKRLNAWIRLNSTNADPGEITVSPLWAQFNDGEAVFDLQVFKAGESVRLKVEYGPDRESGEFRVIPGPYEKIILRLPGEDLKPGDMTVGVEGKRGNPNATTVDSPVQATVYAVDQYWNPTNPTDHNQDQPSIYIYTEEPSHYMQEVVPQTMVEGVAIFSLTLKTAATWWGLITEDVNYPDKNNSSTIDVNAGTFAKLQILAPGENPVPGSDRGKTTGIQPQKAGVSFALVVRAVDQYWNLVDEDRSDEWVDLFSEADPGLEEEERSRDQQFDVNITTFMIYLNWNDGEDVDVTARSVHQPPFVNSDTVMIPIEIGYDYVVIMPTYCTAASLFSMTVRLEDGSGNLVTGADNRFWMTPCLADYSSATNPDGLKEDGVGDPIRLEDGEKTFLQSYDIVEKIRIKVYDEFEREEHSEPIDVQESSLKYKVVVPTESINAGDKFEMIVNLIDTGTGNVVPSKDDEDKVVNLVPLLGGEEARGHLDINSGVVLEQGKATIREQYYTKAEAIQIRAFDDEAWAEAGESRSLEFLPGDPARLQILPDDEIPRPGEWDYYRVTGKTGTVRAQDTGIQFDVPVRIVDQYWNLVDFNGGRVYLSSESGSFDSEPDLSFVGGETTFHVTIQEEGSSFTLTAEADDPPDLSFQSVIIPMERVEYRITSDRDRASTVESFFLTVELVDSTGEPKDGANNSFILTPYTVSYDEAPGKFTITAGTSALKLVDGYKEVEVNYDTAGEIRIKVSDSFGRPEDYTQLIDIEPVGLKYKVVAPENVEAGKEFPLTVRLVDSVRETLVAPEEYDSNRQVRLVAYSFPDESLAEGELKEEYLYLQGGEKTIPQSYSLAQKIYIEASDAPVAEPPDPSSTPDRSGVIEVIGTPKTVMKFDGVYNEMNGALYLRGSTLVRIECISKIEAEDIYYRDNGSEEKTYEEPFSLSPGAHTIEYWGVDKYEHAEQVNKSKTIYISFFSDGVDGVSNQPNPFKAGREETLILYNLKQPSNVTITIYDLLGQEVWHENYREGEEGGSTSNQVPWDGRNLSGKVVANGGYICRIWIEKEKRHMVRKIAVAK